MVTNYYSSDSKKGHIAAATYQIRFEISTHAGYSLYATISWEIPIKFPLPVGDLGSHLMHGSLGPPKSTTHISTPNRITSSPSSWTFPSCSILQIFHVPSLSLLQLFGMTLWQYRCVLHHVPWAQPSPQLKRHLDWFSHFGTAHGCDQNTHRQTQRAL